MKPLSFDEAVARITAADTRYDEGAYHFLREALDVTSKLFEKPAKGPGRHVTGPELLEGIRQYALREFGPMARRVLATWGVSRTEDFGEIVFNLVELGVLGHTENDRREDFAAGYRFDRAFLDPFRAARRERPAGRPGPAGARPGPFRPSPPEAQEDT